VSHLMLCGAWARGTLRRNPTRAQAEAFQRDGEADRSRLG
jgi:hypothetical protein